MINAAMEAFDYQIQIPIHSKTGFRFTWQIEWPSSSKQCNSWQTNNSDHTRQISPNLNPIHYFIQNRVQLIEYRLHLGREY